MSEIQNLKAKYNKLSEDLKQTAKEIAQKERKNKRWVLYLIKRNDLEENTIEILGVYDSEAELKLNFDEKQTILDFLQNKNSDNGNWYYYKYQLCSLGVDIGRTKKTEFEQEYEANYIDHNEK